MLIDFGAPKRIRTPKPSSEDSCDIHFTMSAKLLTIRLKLLYHIFAVLHNNFLCEINFTNCNIEIIEIVAQKS